MAVEVRSLGIIPYARAWELQRALREALIQGRGKETLLVCQHSAVITAGSSSRASSLLVSAQDLTRAGIDYYKVERGGDLTFHGPGQLVAYPILNLGKRKQDVGWYMRCLEEVVIQTLSNYGIRAHRVSGKTGVWTEFDPDSEPFEGTKIAALGVKISRWCTMHGMALNVSNACLDGFSFIHPCGFTRIRVTSMERELGQELDIVEVERQLIEKFLGMF
jgi:lipoyl(octanoyl) transferase